jgi:hypothetical protein
LGVDIQMGLTGVALKSVQLNGIDGIKTFHEGEGNVCCLRKNFCVMTIAYPVKKFHSSYGN